MSVTAQVIINGEVIFARTARNIKQIKGDLYSYQVDDGSEIQHIRTDGAVKIAIKLLETVKEP